MAADSDRLKTSIHDLRESLELAYEALRAVIPDRKHGCLCDECLRTITAEARNDGAITDPKVAEEFDRQVKEG